MSPVLAATLARASELAELSMAAEVTLEHLLAALCEDGDALSVLDASRVQVPRLQADIADYLARAGISGAGKGGALTVAPGLKRILEAAAAAAQGGRRRDINGAIVLAAIVGDGKSAAAQMLQAQGLTFDEAIRALQAALAAPPKDSPPLPAEDVLARARERVQSRQAPSLRDIMSDIPRTAPPPPNLGAPIPPPPPMPPQALPDAQLPPLPPVVASPGAAEARPASAPQSTGAPAQPKPSFIPMPVPMPGPVPAPSPPEAAKAPERAASSASGEPEPAGTADSSGPRWDQAKFEPLPPETSPVPAPAPVAEAGPKPAGKPDISPLSESSAPAQAAAPPPPAPAALEPRLPAPSIGDAYGAGGSGGGYVYPSAPRPTAPAPQPAPHYAPGQSPPPGFDFPRPATAMPPPIPPPIPRSGAGPAMAPGHALPGFPPSPMAAPPPRGGTMSSPFPPSPGGGAQPSATLGAPGAPASGVTPPPQRREAEGSAKKRERGKATMPGQLAENIPRSMRVGRPERVEIRIAKADAKAISDGLEGGGAAWTHAVTITKAMSVRLRAPDGGFFIETASPETQWIEGGLGFASDDFASWRFLITPNARGRARLQIIVSARTVGTDGVAAETALPDQVIDVKVRTNYGRVFMRTAGWIAAAIAGGILARFGDGAFDLIKTTVEHLTN